MKTHHTNTPVARAIAAAGPTAPTAPIPTGLAQFDSLPNSAHVRLPVLIGKFSVSAPTIWRWVKSGRLPAPIKLGPNTTAWRVGELRDCLAGK